MYHKQYGRLAVNCDNLVSEMRRFIFNSPTGIDEGLGKTIAGAFLQELKRVELVLTSEESRVYSASLLFTSEGDGAVLRDNIEQTVPHNNKHQNADTGIEDTILNDDIESCIDKMKDDDELSNPSQIYSLKLTNFTHASWVPGQGPDENVQVGVRSLIRIFDELSC
ncbi:hypothetical protein MFIFM68171_03069 [Madurella fahalii]|uniref:Kinase n=1 Tax=Madurella fahalii TaxID=1157608 RepID=A0ABQ0G543_9PEZI